MNQAAILELYAGGPGSGCHGDTCGRPKSGLQKMLEGVRDGHLWDARNLWVKLANYGHQGNMEPFTKEELRTLKNLQSEPCKVGFCFMNAQKMAVNGIRDSRLQYVEGLVTVYGVPIDHAWIEFNGKVYDPTLATYKPGELGDYSKGGSSDATFANEKIAKDFQQEYFGVTVPKEEIGKHWLKTETYSPLSHEHRNESLQKKIWK